MKGRRQARDPLGDTIGDQLGAASVLPRLASPLAVLHAKRIAASLAFPGCPVITMALFYLRRRHGRIDYKPWHRSVPPAPAGNFIRGIFAEAKKMPAPPWGDAGMRAVLQRPPTGAAA